MTSYRRLYCIIERLDLCIHLPYVWRVAATNYKFWPSCTSMNLVKFQKVPPLRNERENCPPFLSYSTNLYPFSFFSLPSIMALADSTLLSNVRVSLWTVSNDSGIPGDRNGKPLAEHTDCSQLSTFSQADMLVGLGSWPPSFFSTSSTRRGLLHSEPRPVASGWELAVESTVLILHLGSEYNSGSSPCVPPLPSKKKKTA